MYNDIHSIVQSAIIIDKILCRTRNYNNKSIGKAKQTPSNVYLCIGKRLIHSLTWVKKCLICALFFLQSDSRKIFLLYDTDLSNRVEVRIRFQHKKK